MTNYEKPNIARAFFVIVSVCLVFAIMQGVHDNYGIMLNSLVELTGLDYAKVSFVIGVGALIYGVAQPFMGMLALKRSNSFVMLLGMTGDSTVPPTMGTINRKFGARKLAVLYGFALCGS